MKTKKFFTVLSLTLGLLVSSLAFMACGSDDDDNSSNPLVGTWWVATVDANSGVTVYTEITYNADMTCSWKEYRGNRDEPSSYDTGTYKIDGNILAIWWNREKEYWDEDGPWTTTFSITGNKMTTTEGKGTVWTKK